MWSIIDSENISLQVVIDLFDGVETDLEEEVRINTKKELLVYSYRVAGTVGLMMCDALKCQNKNAKLFAIDLGIAMQLTNIARDVCEDKVRNRQYIKPNFSSHTLKYFFRSSGSFSTLGTGSPETCTN